MSRAPTYAKPLNQAFPVHEAPRTPVSSVPPLVKWKLFVLSLIQQALIKYLLWPNPDVRARNMVSTS